LATIASVTAAGNVIAYLIASARMAGPLKSLGRWLLRYNATVKA